MEEKVKKPWGWYKVIHKGERYQTKILHIEPNEELSVQYHLHKSEHWTIVKGTATVELIKLNDQENGVVHMLTEGEHIFIDVGMIHTLTNHGKIPIEIVEVQYGPYLEEDDIFRITDKYNR